MKKLGALAIFILLTGCYTPINNSGVSTNKPWLDVSGTRLDFKGDQYDSCFQFRLHFWPPEVQERLNLTKTCISACCWRSEQNEIILDFNKNFEKELLEKGRARRYTPSKITLKVTHSNFANYTKVIISPQGTISNKGLVKLSYEEIENPSRLAQLAQLERQARPASTEFVPSATHLQPIVSTPKKTTRKKATENTTPKAALPAEVENARAILQTKMGARIDNFF